MTLADDPRQAAHPPLPLPPRQAARLMRAATHASVTVAVTLTLAKLAAWLITDSVSLLSTLLDSLLDAAASAINLVAVHHALQPADEDHRFGHGKAEPLAGLAQAAFISGSAVFLIVQAGQRLFHPRVVVNPDVGYVVLAISIVLTLVLVAFQKYVVRRTGSVAIGADSLHYQTDILVNASIVVSLVLSSRLGWTAADPLFALAIAGYILWGAVGIGQKAYNLLMDRELPEADRQRICEITVAVPGVLGVHDVRTRSSGPQVFIQLHLELKDDMALDAAHDIALAVERALLDAYPRAEVLVHPDPVSVVGAMRDREAALGDS
jgi:ferrous-iron efflux pump FieF